MHRPIGYKCGLTGFEFFGYPLILLLGLLFPLISITESMAQIMNYIFVVNEPAKVWFQRSGSLTTLICIALEGKIIFKVHDSIRGKTRTDTREGGLSQESIKYIDWLQIIILLLLIYGTLIWGYGDLLL